eukprot:Em0018g508a
MALVGRRLLYLRASLSSHIGQRSTSWSDSRTGSLALLARKYSSEPRGKYRYTKSHEWALVEGKTATVGISNYAQEKLGEIVFAELPKLGSQVSKGDAIGVLESVKAAAEVYSPVGGKVTAINESLQTEPELVNKEPYGNGWIMKVDVKDTVQYDSLLSSDDYQKYLRDELSVS